MSDYWAISKWAKFDAKYTFVFPAISEDYYVGLLGNFQMGTI